MTASIQGSAALVIKSLGALPSRLDRAMATGLARGLLYAAGIAQRQFLSGPRPEKLDVRTRRLRDSITTEVEMLPGRITGRIGSNVEYAAFHEFGFHGVVNVRAHTRVVGHLGAGGQSLPTRVEVKNTKGPGFLKDIRPGFVRAGLSNFSGLEQVKAHTRHIDYAGRPFIKPALEQALPAITSEINKEVKAING
jgi:hypothetical protein